MSRTFSAETAATSLASESSYITTLCDLDIHTIKLEAQEDVCVALGKIPDGIFLSKIQGVTIDKFTKWDELESRMGGIFYYNTEHEVLIIKFPNSLPHERLHRELDFQIQRNLCDRGLQGSYGICGQTTFYMKRGASITSAGEGDSSLGPWDPRSNNRWPTLVVEAGWSQTRPALIAKTHWWFEASEGAVKIVLLAIGTPGQIQIQKWKARRGLRSGPITRSLHSSAVQPELRPPVITITRPTRDSVPENYSVTGSPLRLQYSDILPHVSALPQGDLELGDDFLRRYASSVWVALEED